MKMRTTKPEAGNKFYITKSKGGYSTCIEGYPTDVCNVLANCVGYACGRFNEIIGTMKYPNLNCNAENFIERAKSYGLKISDKPVLGGIMVWQKGATLSGSDGAGHVAVVESIIDSNTIITSESGYASRPFWTTKRTNANGRWGIGYGYIFRGCIVNPYVKEEIKKSEIKENPLDKYSDEDLANKVIRGDFGNGEARLQALGNRYNAVQAIVNQKLAKKEDNTNLLELVKRTIRGDFGSGEARKQALGSNYTRVQEQVNLNYLHNTTNWDNIRIY